jgi:hypothetical protein
MDGILLMSMMKLWPHTVSEYCIIPPSTEISRRGKSIEKESRLVVARGWEELREKEK